MGLLGVGLGSVLKGFLRAPETVAVLCLVLACSEKREFAAEPASSGATGGSAASGAAGEGGSDAGAGGGADGGAGGAADESCMPSQTTLCWETEDGEPLPEPPDELLGSCRFGVRTCGRDRTWGACIGAVAPQESDSCEPGADESCNGVPNEGCRCSDGDTRACGEDRGNCELGTQTCSKGVWGACTGGVRPQAQDSCAIDGDDANCNGVANEGCPCIADETQACNDCGTRSCEPAKRAWGSCSAPRAPAITRCSESEDAVETCNSAGRWASTSCSAPSAQCTSRCEVSDGVASCVVHAADVDSDGYGSKLCTQDPGTDCDDTRASVHPGAAEICDGLDNDCDGKADLADGLSLSGQNEPVGGTVTGLKRPSITWSQDLRVYGLLWAGDANGVDGDLRFQTIDQAGKPLVGPISINSAEDGATRATAIAWGADRFGTIYQTSDENLRVLYLDVSAEGRPGSAREVNGSPAVSGNTYSLARVGAGNWGMLFNTCYRGCNLEYRTLTASGTLSPLTHLSGAVSNGVIIATESGFVLGYQADSGPRAELRSSTLAGVSAGPALAGTSPVFGAAPGGFAVAATREGMLPTFASFKSDGSTQCAARAIGDDSFVPAAIIGTDAGYLIASSGDVRIQLVSPSCVPGPIVSLSATANSTVAVAGGSDGYAVFWDAEPSQLWRRFFGPQLCN